MNLSGFVAPYIGVVNPPICALVKSSDGFTSNPDGSRSPKYIDFPDVSIQDQPVSTSSLRRLDGLNIQGIMRSMYLNGRWDGVNRPRVKGGDMVVMQDGATWLVTVVAEAWAEWTHVIVTLQVKGA